ncbi:hypothetical protein [[Clostridium] colinum]|uniref:hypothetical protein n=1 Tax=[Clostridium] colinum TaxID=36835 RepID=UPI002024FF33|nr:hypothetical protein [[Clostridium] colinum]
MNYFETNEAKFNSNLEKIKETDKVHADTPNKRFEQLINNDVALKNELEKHNHDNTYSNINHKHNEYIANIDFEGKINNVAKETEKYKIENKVTEISDRVNRLPGAINNNTTNLQKLNTSTQDLQNKVTEISTQVGNLGKKFNDLSSVKKIQVFNGSFSNRRDMDSKSITINSVDVNKTLVLTNCLSNDTTNNDNTEIIAYLYNASTLRFNCLYGWGNDFTPTKYFVQVIEFN